MKIPKDYRRLEQEEILKAGDLFCDKGKWKPTILLGFSAGDFFYIRKIEARKLKEKKL